MSVTKYMVFTPGSTAPLGGPWTQAQLRTRRATGEVSSAATVSSVGESTWHSVDEVLTKLDAEPLWLVRGPGADEVVGPVSTDLVRRGLAAGKIPGDSLAAEAGTTDWVPVLQIAALPTAAGSVPLNESASTPEHAQPVTARKDGRSRLSYVAGGLVALGLAGAVTVGLMFRGPASPQAAPSASTPTNAHEAAVLGFKLYDDDNNEAGAVRLWEPACEKGDDLACTGMATAYTFGVGGKPKDETKALGVLDAGCSRGTMRACNLLARFHYFAMGGTPKDIDKARALWRKACDADEPHACYWLGLVYSASDGPPAWRDEREARLVYGKGCRLGHKDSCDGVAKLDRAARIESLRKKVTWKYFDKDRDALCTGKGLPPYRWSYEGGTFQENEEVATADGCKSPFSFAENTTFCCPKQPF